MNIAPRYLGRGSWLARRDPRVLIVVIFLFIFAVLQVWDGRVVFALLLISIGYYRLAGIPWRHIRRNWAVVLLFIGLLVTVNTIVFGGGDVAGRSRSRTCTSSSACRCWERRSRPSR